MITITSGKEVLFPHPSSSSRYSSRTNTAPERGASTTSSPSAPGGTPGQFQYGNANYMVAAAAMEAKSA